jgi:predicted RNA-binding Zn ribbon-like protein
VSLTGIDALGVRTLPYVVVEREALLDADVQPGGRAPAPPPLDLVQAFVNTVDREHGPDLLDEGEGLEEWLARRGFPRRVSSRDLAHARKVREALRTVMWGHGGGDVDRGGATMVLDAAAARARLRPRFETGTLRPEAEGVDGALGAILAAAFAAIADGTFARLKACPGERCGWAFYDRSPTVSATWCSMRVCGGREKARSYYRRRRA